jgi:excisionase family DNA binding protein
MTVKEFARQAEISLSLAYELIAEGRVGHRRVGRSGRRGKILIEEEALRRFIEETRVQPANGGSGRHEAAPLISRP